jgi:hypothetical protein
MINGGLASRAAKQVLDSLLRMSLENMEQALRTQRARGMKLLLELLLLKPRLLP